MADPGQFIDAIGASLSEDGQIAELQVQRANGQTAYLQFPAAAASSILLTVEQALAKVFELQRARLAGQDPRTFFPIGAKRVTKIQGAIASTGVPVLSLELDSGIRLDFSLDPNRIRDLIEWLEELQAVQSEPPQPPN